MNLKKPGTYDIMDLARSREEYILESKEDVHETISRELLAIEDKSEQLKYTCLDCDYKTKGKSNIGKHMVTVHEQLEKEANFICGICNHEFRVEEQYNTHIKSHDMSRGVSLEENVRKQIIEISSYVEEVTEKIECGQCAFTFPSLLDLNAHIDLTHKEKAHIEENLITKTIIETSKKGLLLALFVSLIYKI